MEEDKGEKERDCDINNDNYSAECDYARGIFSQKGQVYEL